MPAASAEKRARQRANKHSKIKSTAEPAVRTAQSPDIMSLPVQTTDSTSTLQTSRATSLPSIDFETFIELADLDDVLRFCNAVASTQGRNLKLLWDRAFEAGLNQGRAEERDLRDEAYLQGKAMGIKQAEEAARCAEIDLYSHGIEKGRAEERFEWTSIGHGLHCLSPVAILSDQIIQTDLEPPILPLTTDSSVQTTSSSSLSISTQTESISEPPIPTTITSAPLNWADDPVPFPSQVSPTLLPRDFSGFRSSNPNPFSSLRHRSKRFTRYSRQSRHTHNFEFSCPSYRSRRAPLYPSHSYPHACCRPPAFTSTSHLNWESDPRLSDLSRSLKALGWIRVQVP
jgi:hypothetical protein